MHLRAITQAEQKCMKEPAKYCRSAAGQISEHDILVTLDKIVIKQDNPTIYYMHLIYIT